MSYQDELLTLLCSPERIGATLDIEGAIYKVKPTLQMRFWQAAHGSLLESLGNAKWSEQWHLEKIFDPIKEPKRNDTGFRCVVRNPTRILPRIQATLSVWDSRLSVGVGFTAMRPGDWPQVVNDLSRRLQQDQFHIASGPQEQAHWIAWKECDINLDDKEFLINVASDPALVIDKAVGSFTEFFRNHREAMEAADAALG